MVYVYTVHTLDDEVDAGVVTAKCVGGYAREKGWIGAF